VIDTGTVDYLPLAVPARPSRWFPAVPTTINEDGKYDDVNGNGRIYFADVVRLFNHL